jgi:clan AA aspartic protease (TIGR02281 family)
MLAIPLPFHAPSPARILPAAVLALWTLLPSPAAADLYRWVDDRGQTHFTNDLGSVPPTRLARLEPLRLGSGRSTWNVVDAASRPAAASRRHVVALERVGQELRAQALLNDALEARFVIDTGASLSAIPRSVADALGIAIDARTPQVEVSGIGGETWLAPLVTLHSLEVGGARIEQVELVVLDSMTVGLLGMSFLGHFKVQMDPVGATLALEPLDTARPARTGALDYELSWNGVRDAARYYVQVSSDSVFEDVVGDAWVTGTRVGLESLEADHMQPGTYYWRIAAVDDAGAMSPWSEARDFEYR